MKSGPSRTEAQIRSLSMPRKDPAYVENLMLLSNELVRKVEAQTLTGNTFTAADWQRMCSEYKTRFL